MTFFVLNPKNLRVALLLLVATRPALSHVDLNSISKATETSAHGPVDELDAHDASDCFSLGELDIAFRTHNKGKPNVGVVLRDPRARRIGFDPLTKHAWQELPVAQGYIDCDGSDGVDTCQGLIEICGAVSGVYQLEVIAQQTTFYNLHVFGRSKSVLDAGGVRFSRSETDLSNLPIHEGSREIVSLKYSRDPQENLTAQLQSQREAEWHDAGLYRKGVGREERFKSGCNEGAIRLPECSDILFTTPSVPSIFRPLRFLTAVSRKRPHRLRF